MPVKKAAKKAAPKAKPSAAKKSRQRELSDSELKTVSGGLSSQSAVSLRDTGGCVSQF